MTTIQELYESLLKEVYQGSDEGKIIKAMFEHSDKIFTVIDIADCTELDEFTVRKYLSLFEKKAFVDKTIEGCYVLNKENPLCKTMLKLQKKEV